MKVEGTNEQKADQEYGINEVGANDQDGSTNEQKFRC